MLAYAQPRLAGHQGRERTLQVILRNLWAKEDVTTYINGCVECVTAKTPKPKGAFLRAEMIAPEPFHTVFVDHVQVVESKTGNKYVLTMYCGTIGWMEAVAVKNVTAPRGQFSLM